MIIAVGESIIEVRAAGFPTGLAGTVARRLLAPDGTTLIARTTSDIRENPAGSGSYVATMLAPPKLGRSVIIFDRGDAVSPSTVTAEILEVTSDGEPQQFGPGALVPILLAGFPTGLVGTLGYQVLDENGEQVAERKTSGIIELLAGSGDYIATVAYPPAAGRYSVFADYGTLTPSTVVTEEIIVVGDPTRLSWEPTIAEVAARVPMRPKGDFGRLTTFTEDTQPTTAQVELIIDTVIARLTGRFGSPPNALIGVAKEVATLEAAMRVELDYFADQVQAGRSPYNELVALHETALADYLTDRANLGDDGLPGTADDQVPAYSFPPLGPVPHAPGSETPIDVFGLDW